MEILRIRFIFNHNSPFYRDIIEELTLLNNESSPLSKIIVPLNKFRLGLHIYDADGYELPYLPKDKIREVINSTIIDEEALAFYNKFINNNQILWIDLPVERVIKKGETRIIRLEYKDDENIPTYKRSFFHIPHYRERGAVNINSICDTFYLINGPSDYNIDFKLEEGVGVPKLYRNHTGHFVSIRIPSDGGTYDYAFNYK